MKKSTVSRLLSMTLALSMTLSSGSMAVFADSEDAAAEVETVSVVEEDAENAVPAEDAAEEAEVVTEAADTGAEAETVVQSETEESAPAEMSAAEEIVVETQAAADDSAGIDIEVAAAEETEQADAALEEEADVRYVMMNVPYKTFYAAYNLTDMAVWEVEDGIDAVSTATTSKFTGTGATGMAQGTYNDGKYIRGVVIPVKVAQEAYEKLSAGTDSNADYYFTDLSENPAVYSELTINENGSYSFTKLQDAVVTTEYLSVGDAEGQVQSYTYEKGQVSLTSSYGDYVFAIGGMSNPNHGVQTGTDTYEACTIYGAVVKTTAGDLGMTALENLWYGGRYPFVEIALSVPEGKGLKRGHGNGGEFYQFAGLNGATLNSVDLITSIGVIHVSANDIKLPSYYDGDLSTLRFAITNDSDQLSISGIPEAFEKVTVSVSYRKGRTTTFIAEEKEIVDGKVALNSKPADGVAYTVTINSSNYPAISRTVSTPIAESQKNELTALIEKAKLTIGYEENADLKEHVQEAEEMLANTAAASVDAAELIKELQDKIKAASKYVLMNIPYEAFYKTEGVSGVDVVSTATVKTYNQNMAAGSYHEGYTAPADLKDAKILGITYPVLIEENAVMEALKKQTEVKDEDSATITVASGKSSLTTKEVSGSDLLFASGDYAYYVMKDEPASYKTLTVGEDGTFIFSAVSKAADAAEFGKAEITYGGHYTDIAFTVADETNINGTVYAITLTAEGEKYALRHVEDIWRLTSLGWNWDSLDGKGLQGKTITNVTYYVKNETGYGVYSYDVNLPVKLNPGTEAAASFANMKAIEVTGLPEDIKTPKAEVKTQVGRGETATTIAENVDVTDGKIVTESDAAYQQAYVVTITSENYGDISVNATCEAAEAEVKALIETANGTFKTAAEAQAAIDAAKTAYAKLTAAEKALLPNAEKDLEKAQSAATKQKNAEDAAKNSGTGNKSVNNNTQKNQTQTVTKQSQSLKKLTPATKKLKASKLKKKKQTFKLKATINGKGKVTFKKVSGNKKITISKAGKVTVKKGLKKGTYKVKVKVSIAATGNYKAASATKTIKIKVK